MRKRDKEGPAVYLADGLPPFLAIVAPRVDPFQPVRISKDLRGIGEIEPSLGQGPEVLRLVPLEYNIGGNAV